jgi:hypothetical protein
VNTDTVVATALGFVSGSFCALLGAWVQSRLRIKEQRLQREQLRRDRAEDEAAQAERERQTLIAALSDLRAVKPLQDVARHIGESVRDSDRGRFGSVWRNSLVTWWSDDKEPGSALQRMSFAELSLLYTASIGAFGLWIAGGRQWSEIRQRVEEIALRLNDIERLSAKGDQHHSAEGNRTDSN